MKITEKYKKGEANLEKKILPTRVVFLGMNKLILLVFFDLHA